MTDIVVHKSLADETDAITVFDLCTMRHRLSPWPTGATLVLAPGDASK